MSEANKPKISAVKICESCGEEFSCGAKSGKCWCFEIDLESETLAKLREDFENCLCGNCLRKTQFEGKII